MATIINTGGQPVAQEDSTSASLGLVFAVVLLLILAAMVFYYGPGLVRGITNQSAPQINIPGKIDVNVNKGQ